MYLVIQERDSGFGSTPHLGVTNDLHDVNNVLKAGGTVYNLDALPKLKELHVDYIEVYEEQRETSYDT